MHPSIGELSTGKFYSHIYGYGVEPYIGTLEEVEIAMGLREAAPAPAANLSDRDFETLEVAPAGKTYNVTLTFQYPAWDEVQGIEYQDIGASSKSEANAIARKMADRDGHLGSGKGRATFVATEQR